MENKINIAELLKDCPRGMELDCTMFEGLEFDGIVDNEFLPIRCRIKNSDGRYYLYNFTKYGCWSYTTFAKCVIFPKGKTTWEGFQRPFKDGDIVVGKNYACSYITIFKEFIDNISFSNYVCLTSFGSFKVNNFSDNANLRFATEEEKAKLFDAIKAKGYKWNTETKTLERLAEPRFKVGDRIKAIINNNQYVIKEITDTHYNLVEVNYKFKYTEPISEDKNWELVPNKFDISNLKPFDKVLVRCSSLEKWHIQFFEKYNTDSSTKFPFICLCNNKYSQCIPYENNQHLLDTANDCNDFYKTWE